MASSTVPDPVPARTASQSGPHMRSRTEDAAQGRQGGQVAERAVEPLVAGQPPLQRAARGGGEQPLAGGQAGEAGGHAEASWRTTWPPTLGRPRWRPPQGTGLPSAGAGSRWPRPGRRRRRAPPGASGPRGRGGGRSAPGARRRWRPRRRWPPATRRPCVRPRGEAARPASAPVPAGPPARRRPRPGGIRVGWKVMGMTVAASSVPACWVRPRCRRSATACASLHLRGHERAPGWHPGGWAGITRSG
jgi:hypothetical protein